MSPAIGPRTNQSSLQTRTGLGPSRNAIQSSKARRVKAINWKRHDNHIHDKVTEWFKVVGKVLQDLAILPENCYNMDETGVLLSMLGSVKVLVGKDDLRDYRGAGVKRTMVTAIECISADGRSLLPLIIWPALTH